MAKRHIANCLSGLNDAFHANHYLQKLVADADDLGLLGMHLQTKYFC